MNKHIRIVSAIALAALLVPCTGFSETLEVAAGSPLTISTDLSSTYDNIVAHSCVIITNGGKFNASASAINQFGTESTDAAGLWIISGGGSSAPEFITATSWSSRLVFSGALVSPAFLVKGNSAHNYPFCTVLDSAATTSADEFNFLRLEGSSARISFWSIWNNNDKPAVVTFAGGSGGVGGTLRLYNYYSSDDLRGLRVPAEGNKIILRGESTSEIRLYSYAPSSSVSAWHFPYSADAGTIETDGDCDLVFSANSSSDRGYVNLNKAYDDGQVVWGHTGETRFCNHVVTLNSSNALPYSASAIRTNRVSALDGAASDVAYLDLNGYSAKAGCLLVESGAYVTNSSSTAATLVFGADDMDAEFSGEIYGDVTIVKQGTGILKIGDGSVVPTIRLDNADISSVEVSETATVGEWEISPSEEGSTTYTIQSGETFDVAPFSSEPAWNWDSSWTNLYSGGSASSGGQGYMGLCLPLVVDRTGLSNGLHRVAVSSGGTAVIDVASGDAEKYEYLALTGEGSLEKSGAGTATFLGDGRLSLGGVHVADGTLRFAGRGCTNEYWRLTVLETYHSSNYSFYLGKIGIFGDFGEWLCEGLTYTSYNYSGSLGNGEFTYAVDSLEEEPSLRTDHEANDLFTINYWDLGLAFQNQRASQSDNVTFTMRLPAGRKPAVWHSLAREGSYAYNPYSWTLETSTDGADWTNVVSVEKDPLPSGDCYYYWRNDQRYGTIEGIPWRIGLDNAMAAVGSLGTVQVDADATLDLSATTNAVISSMAVDATSFGGTIVGGSLSDVGAIDVISTGGMPKAGSVLLTLDGVDGAASINKWSFTLNGAEQSTRILAYDSSTGEVKALGRGLTVIFR